eukprot:4658082-Prymnesium_polylepis.2
MQRIKVKVNGSETGAVVKIGVGFSHSELVEAAAKKLLPDAAVASIDDHSKVKLYIDGGFAVDVDEIEN